MRVKSVKNQISISIIRQKQDRNNTEIRQKLESFFGVFLDKLDPNQAKFDQNQSRPKLEHCKCKYKTKVDPKNQYYWTKLVLGQDKKKLVSQFTDVADNIRGDASTAIQFLENHGSN